MLRTASRLLIPLIAGAALISAPTIAHSDPPKPDTAEEIVAAMQPGWNLGNTFDAMCCGEDETAWGNPRVTEDLLAAVRAQGFNSIRIPVSWGNHTGPAPDYTVEPAVMARVQEVVDMALDEGFYVLINIHHDSWQWVKDLPTRHDEVLAQYNATWTQIAETFKDHPPELTFESINEPFFEGSSGEAHDHELLAELNSSFHSIVRSSGSYNADRLLVLPTLHTNAGQQHLDALAEEIVALDDPMLAATTHNYGFWPFSVNIAGYTEFDAEVAGYLEGDFDRMYDTFVSKGVPVVLGEYGLLGFDRHTGTVEQGEKLKFFEYFGYLARTRGVTIMWWDNWQHFDRTAFQWRDQDLYEQIASSWTERSGTAESDLVFVRASDPITDHEIELNLNGQKFKGLYEGSTKLKHKKDYVLEGSRLTLNESLLTRLAADRAYGTSAVLEVRFSGGVPWKLHVVNCDTPVLQDASGTTAGLEIPTAFNGDQLATMEAKYTDGSNAGPHTWTSFKEFALTFEPEYEDGHITLTSTFFNEVQDDSTVILTFHFWSGEQVQYTFTRSGTTVTGTAT